MTPDSPISPEGKPSKPRHRANLDNLAKDTTEQDLWDFGDDDSPVEMPPKKPKIDIPAKQPVTKASKKQEELPERPVPQLKPIDDEEEYEEDFALPVVSDPEEAPIQRLTDPAQPKRSGTRIDTSLSSFGSIDDDDDWDLNADDIEIPVPPSDSEAESTAAVPDSSTETGNSAAEEPPAPRNGGENRKKPRIKINLAKSELISIAALVLLLLGVGIFFYANSLSKIPAPPKITTADDFPIKGKHFTAVKADTFWRKPVESGDHADNVRRGTLLIPVLKLSTEGGSGAVRVMFRDSDGNSVGDVISRQVSGKGEIEIPATAGFDEMNMHAAYRTGDIEPWFVEVHQGPSVNAPGTAFSKLFEIPISTQLQED
ncbi:hypothetical protein JIN85_15105 [Luteolibacter pohnpeiensis]|uniref:Uncharacterized protein n=1 Tax=Luteolibacter pohnpeiensis TaxID=454153 RepID=A0A934VWX9_9BACT|nr:hypothetical protein [Luteolibacter pohnpeiensis]MBK1883745.1 hypothetical protein [Luteolibacter pohnpeiensis]